MSNDVKQYVFQSAGVKTITCDNSGNVALYSIHPIKGEILKIVADYNNSTNTGSLILNVSGGIANTIWSTKSFSADFEKYPMVNASDNSGVAIGAGSSDLWRPIVIDDVLQLVGSGLGDTKIVNSFTIYYR